MNRKRFLIILVVLAIFLSASSEPVKLVELTIVNKSDMPIGVRMIGAVTESNYYLRVEKGDKEAPTSKTFEIATDFYVMTVNYIETWDPVYGFKCGTAPTKRLLVSSDTRVIYLPCGQRPPNPGERTMIKFWPAPFKFNHWKTYFHPRYRY